MADQHVTIQSWRTKFLGAGRGEAGMNVSWAAILAGAVTSIAVLMSLSLIGVAIGLGVPDLDENQPFEGLSVGLSIWAVLALLISLAAGGFVTGVLAGRAGFMNGVVTWAVSLIALVVAIAWATSAALGAVGSLVGGAASLVGQGAGSVASAATAAVDGVTDQAADALGDVDTDELQSTVEQVLADTDVPELQPGYLQDQVDQAGSEVLEAGRQLLTNPEDYEAILGELTDRLQARVDTVAAAADREAIANAVESNTDLTQAEAEQATNNIVTAYEEAAQTVQEQLDDAQATIAQAQETVRTTVDDAREVAEDATNAAATAAGWAFVGVLLGLAVTAFSALGGNQLVARRSTADPA